MKRVVVILFAVASVTLVFRSDRSIIDRPIIEDSYYPLTVAKNIAGGRGITIDGSTRTNGFQPLFTLLTVPAFVLSDGDEYKSIRFVLALHWMIYIMTAWLLGLIARDARVDLEPKRRASIQWTTCFVYLSSLYVFMNHFNGLETGCLLLLYAAAWRLYQVGGMEQRSGRIKLGIILGLLVLARIDAVFLVAAISLFELIVRRGVTARARLGRFVTVAGIAFLVSSPWWIYSLAGFGALMPSSGSAQQAWTLSFLRMRVALSSLFQVTVPQLYLSRFEYFHWQGKIGANLLRVGLTLGILALVWRRRAEIMRSLREAAERGDARKRTVEFGGCLLASSLVLVLWYTASSWAVHFYGRYFAPIFLPSTLILSFFLFRTIERAPRLGFAVLTVLCLPVLISIGMLHSGRGFVGNTYFSHQLQLVSRTVPEDDSVAACQSATLGYFRDRVVNLDGKVNREALAFRGNMHRYLVQKGIRWICDWPSYISRYLGEPPENLGWRWIAARGNFVLYRLDGEDRGGDISHQRGDRLADIPQ